jgi:hypothetical protein
MVRGARHALAIAGVVLLLAGGCSDDDAPTTTAAGGPTSSAPGATSTTVRATTTSPTTVPPTTLPAGPTVAEAGGWRMAITAPTRNAKIGPELDLCYEVTGTARESAIAFEVSLIVTQTRTVAATVRVDAAVGRGSARVSLGTPQPRFYDMTVQGLVNGQPLNGLLVTVGVDFGVAPPAGCP